MIISLRSRAQAAISSSTPVRLIGVPRFSKNRSHFLGPELVSSYRKMGDRSPAGVVTARNCSISTLKEN